MSSAVKLANDSELETAFPKIDPGIRPMGSRLLVQVRTPPTKTKGGIILHRDTADTEKWNTQTGVVLAVGPLAFKDRDTLEPWPEGAWCKPGDFIRVPKYGGDRWEMENPARRDEPATFIIINDSDVIGVLTCDPMKMKAFI